MRLRIAGLIALVGLALVAGCKSKETTSAIIHNQTGRYDLAIQTASEAIAINPEDPEAHFQLALAYSHVDSVALAYTHFVKSAQLDPKPKRQANVQTNIQSNYAKHYNVAIKKESDRERLAEFTKAAEADPRRSKSFLQLGRTYAALADKESNPEYLDKAVENFDKVLELASPADKDYTDALESAGGVLAKAGRPEEAVSRFNRLVEEDPTNYRMIETIGIERLKREDWKGATVFLDLAARARAKINADNFELFYNIGVAYFQLGKQKAEHLPTAIEYYEKALNMQPNEPTTTYNILAAHVVAEDWESAITWGERYVELDSENEKGWQLLSRAYSEVGDQQKATQCMRRYEQIIQGE